MPQFIGVMDLDGDEQYVNPHQIRVVRTHERSTDEEPVTELVFYGGNTRMLVKGTKAKVKDRLNGGMR